MLQTEQSSNRMTSFHENKARIALVARLFIPLNEFLLEESKRNIVARAARHALVGRCAFLSCFFVCFFVLLLLSFAGRLFYCL